MHFERRSASIMEGTSETNGDLGITKISMNLGNMTSEQMMEHFALLDNFTQHPADLDILKEKPWQIFIIVLYSIVILLGFVENCVVVIVLLKNKHLHTPTNIFIIGLAMSDILLCSFNLPFQLHYQLTDQWAFGGILCKVIMPTFGVPIFVSSMSMLMIAIDRYMLIVHPFKARMTKAMAIGIVIAIAWFSTVLAIPLIIHTEYVELNIPALRVYKEFCIEEWPTLIHRRAYTLSTVLIQLFIPLIITSVVYFNISTVLKNRPIKRNETRRNHKTNKILISIVVLFSICWVPWNLLAIVLEFKPLILPGRYVEFVDLLLKIFAMSSACVNPFLYGWLNDNFRKEFDVLLKRPGRNRIRQNGNTYTLAEQSRTDADKFTTIL